MKADHRRTLGQKGEAHAADYLTQKGYTIIDRNYRTSYGEIDIVARQGESIVFVEVKTRASHSLGPPEIAITRRKAQHMRNAAEDYIQNHPGLSDNWRIDVVTLVLRPKDSLPTIDHFENAIH